MKKRHFSKEPVNYFELIKTELDIVPLIIDIQNDSITLTFARDLTENEWKKVEETIKKAKPDYKMN